MRQRKWSVVLAMVVATGAAVGGVIAVLPGTEASASVTGGVTVAGGNGSGSAANQINGPTSVFVNSAGDVYVDDEGNQRVQEWSPGAISGVTVAGGNGSGSAANQLNQPLGMWVDGSGDVYVADSGNDRVQKWAPGAISGVTVAGGNGSGSAPNQLSFPNSVFVDGAGDLYVTDEANDRVQEWAPGATAGVTVAGGNGSGSAANQFSIPDGVFVDGAGDVYVSDGPLGGNSRVQKWAPGATAGATVAGGNGSGSAANQLSDPAGLAVDSSGDVYVADSGNNRVQEWAPGATAGVTVAGGNGAGAAADQLSEPLDAFVDGTGNIYVADNANNRVQEYKAGPNGVPTVIVDPLSQTVPAGTSVTFSADASGQPLPSAQWQQSTDGGSTWSDIAGAMASTYTVTGVPLSDNGFEFRAVFTNAGGSAITDPAMLTVSPPGAPAITIQPSSQSVVVGSNVSFSADASGTPAPTVQWQQSSDEGSTWSNISGATSSTYTIPNVPLSDNGFEFRAVFTNGGGSATTDGATLTVLSQVAPTIAIQPTSQNVAETTSATFGAVANGTPTPGVQWQQSTDGGSTWSDIAGATSIIYTISNVPLSDNGLEFRAVFTNAVGSATTNAATLTVTVPPAPTASVALPANDATVSGSIWLDAVASSPVGLASVTFEVSGGSISNQVIGSGTPWIYGYLGAWDTHDVPNGTYTLQSVATDTLGQSTTSAPITVTVANPPIQTAVVLPANGATVSGSTWLDASAQGPSDTTGVQYVLSGGSLSNQVIATATATLYGWLAYWNTASVPNGTYTLQSVATEVGGSTATSPGITVTVAN